MKRIGVRPYLFITAAVSIAVGLGLLAIFVAHTARREVNLFGHHRTHAEVVRVATTLARLYNTRGLTAMELGAQHFADLLNSRLVIDTAYGRYTVDPFTAHPARPGVTPRLIATVPIPAGGLGVGARLKVYGLPFLGPRLSPVLSAIERSLIWASLAGFLTALTLSVVVGEWLVQPIRRITEGVRRLGEGDLERRVEVAGPAEVAELGDNFNRMAAALSHSEENRRQMVADVAHELRTPLSILMGYLEAMRDGVVPSGDESLQVVETQGRHLTRLVQDLQELALSDAGELATDWEALDLRLLTGGVVPAWQVEARARGVDLRFADDGPSLPVRGDPERLRQVLGNFLANAIKYTPQGGRVVVRASRAGAWARVSVSDTGPGIPAEDLPHLFERFYRVDRARSSRTGGSGLGLAIAKNLVERQGGRVGVDSQISQGSTIWLELPLTG
ncbi:MAG: sensor histidine kinase [Clostridia bacterium]